MENFYTEAAFMSLAGLDLLLVYLASRLGVNYLAATIPANLLYTNVISGKLITIFGLTTTLGNATFIGIYFASDLLCEHGYRDLSRSSLNHGLLALLILITLSPIAVSIAGCQENKVFSDALSIVLGSSFRIVVASATAYFLSSQLNINLYMFLRKKVENASCCNFLSATAAYSLDQLVFISIAFLGSVTSPLFFELLLTGMLIKLFCAITEAAVFSRAARYNPKSKD